MLARVGRLEALVDVDVAAGALEALPAPALVVVAEGDALGAVAARLVGAVVLLRTRGPGPAQGTRALVRVQRAQRARASVLAGSSVARVGHGGLKILFLNRGK